MNKKKNEKYLFMLWLAIFAIALVKRELQNDTFYSIKIGEYIINHGIDMMDHFSFHTGLAYTYPHWLYDTFIYLLFKSFGYMGIYISSIVLFLILLFIVFKTNFKMCHSNLMAAFITFICALSISSFVTARAQLVSFILFAAEIYFIESFLKNGKKKYLVGLLLISLLLCNIHVAVWPFYFILYLPYLVEYIISHLLKRIKKENKFLTFLNNRFDFEDNDNVKYLFITMLLSTLTGLLTPIGNTPYTYLIKTMMGNSQKYIKEHQMLTWKDSPFTIIIAFETLILAILSKIKLRDLFMVLGLTIMSVISIRHLSLLALLGTISFGRIFMMFIRKYDINISGKLMPLLGKKIVTIIMFLIVITFSCFMLSKQAGKDFVNKELYPVDAVKYIKKNINLKDVRIYNEYNFGSYLILNDIPVFIDSRADLYTKQFSGFDYDIFDDYEYIASNYQKKFEDYGITHVLTYKDEKNNLFYNLIKRDDNYKLLYEDKYFVLYEKLGKPKYIIDYSDNINFVLGY